MADTGLQPMRLTISGKVRTQPVRRLGLADARYVIVLAFDRKQADTRDAREVNGPAAMRHFTEGQRVANKDGLDGLQIILGREIHHSEILVVKFLVLVRG